MDFIFSSKLYRSSNRKDKIRAAIDDPINKELVVQLREYLNEDSLPEPEPEVEESTEGRVVHVESIIKEAAEEQIVPAEIDEKHEDEPEDRPSEKHSLEKRYTELEKKFDEDAVSEPDVQESEEQTVPEEASEVPEVESATSVSGEPVQAATALYTPPSFVTYTYDEIARNVKDLLNLLEDTSGVVRASAKDSELWIYYNDRINLNNVMEPVISLLNAANYTNLEFNRLARSENAIVFLILDSKCELKSIVEIKKIVEEYHA